MQPEHFTLFAEIEDRHWWFVARREVLCAVVEALLPPRGGAKIVDIGCGTGGVLAAFAGRYDCIGVDPSADAIRVAEEHHPAVSFLRTTDAEAMRLHGDAALFLFLDVLEHVEADRDMLRRIALAMRPGSLLLLTVPADMSLWSLHDEAVGHFRRYDASTFPMLWSDLPVRVKLFSPFNAFLLPFIRLARLACRWKRTAWGEHATDFSVPPAPLNALLRRIFTQEQKRLLRVLAGNARPFRRGVSLIAVLERV